MSDELYFLNILHNIGATTFVKALTLQDISRWTSMETEKLKENLRILTEGGYVETISDVGVHKYFVTTDGIRKVLSMYS
jgi:hypothetical protein